MGELLKNAFLGFRAMNGQGKLFAILFLVLLLCFLWKLGEGKQRELLSYGGIAAVLCIFPVTAVLLMLWQTKFYDYEFVWTIVPLTALISCGIVLVMERLLSFGDKPKQKLLLAFFALAILLLCGKLGNPKWTVANVNAQRKEVSAVLQSLKAGEDQTICLWAPKKVMENARSLDGEVTLLYGRNMWQEHLNAYSYEEYSQEQRDLYVWMSLAEGYGTLDVPVPADLDVVGKAPEAGSTMEGLECIKKAMTLGANRILLPGSISEESIKELEQKLGVKTEKLEGYWLLR